MDWNTKLFLKINSLVGRNPWLDAFGRAGAEWAIVAMVAWYLLSTWMARTPDNRAILLDIVILASAWGVGLLLNWLIGLLVQEPRPQIRNPETRLLLRPLSTWKSFPSDHALAAFLIFFLSIVLGLPGSWALFILALWVGWGRVYAGVHYPFDIVGGISVAGLMAVTMYYLLLRFNI